MTEKEAMEAPLHEVWVEFQKSLEWALSICRVEKSTRKAKNRQVRRNIENSAHVGIEEVEMLRRVLLERCDNHKFDHVEPDMGANPAAWVLWHKGMAAFHSFWAWELDQRKMEDREQNPQ